ncbi:Ger(x)C family spore germination protein [Paenibacillus nanensis]|uniref:Ger(X)C family spore germination protein n=1 Tax=Paenibacillus nanensis TaxID=393251 RepID=A0A3A1VJ01_9BACL|nr:Ger(x)C family spore germination protein [Paenibacillus nanensis]RIX60467.1 Ger(x)C family spore germination protein [Paenibacillus nanensis]
MLRFGKAAIASAVFALLLSGCWDLKDLQEVNYVRALGFDLKGKEFIVYAQMLDFSSIAKAEGGKGQQAPAWIGIGRGETLTDAFSDVYRTAQLRLFYGHVSAIVIGEKLLENRDKLKEIYEVLSRYFEIRYTPWIFGTAQPVDKLLAVTSLFSFSQNVTVMHQPQETYKQRSFIRPITMRQFNVDLREPGKTTLLPSLAVSENSMKRGEKSTGMLEMNGAYIINSKDQYRGWVSYETIKGIPWVEPETIRAPVILKSKGEIEASLFLERPKIKIKPHIENGLATYTMRVELTGNMTEMVKPMTESDIERKAEEEVRREILSVFREGLKRKADLLQLEQALYRQNVREWKRLSSQGLAEPKADSLKDVKVIVKVNRTGKTKSRDVERW